jgi:asparagine synthase (glutamine-hydrolysing)
MCGIAGFLWSDAAARRSLDPQRVLDAMADTLVHRGPDDRGSWFDPAAGIGLGHRRLSIIDLSADGHQPMISASQRYVVIFNGEIYNFRSLGAELGQRGHRFRGHSDTEVLLAGFDSWGLEETLRRANGMFAIALWDREERVLHLTRDRIGKKPLYYGWAGPALVFGSELKALLAYPEFQPRIDPGSLALFLRHDYVPAPWSIFQDVFKLLPGSILSFKAADVARGPKGFSPHSACRYYWNPHQVIGHALQSPLALTAEETVERLDELLRDAVALRMHADVALGAFLSGGTDSSTVVALMQAQAQRPVQTFTIGFHDPRHDEARLARAVAEHLGTDHTELYVTGEDALAVVPDLPRMFDEPFADSSQIPTYLVARLARQKVTVALSGDGGDELFYGYTRYQRAQRVWRWQRRATQPVRRALSAALGGYSRTEARTSKLGQLASELAADSAAAVYLNRVSRWRLPETVVRDGHEHPTPFTDRTQQQSAADTGHALMYLDLVTYLPEDILTKVDRASMSVGLEARAPLLDWRVVELAFRIPLHMKLQGGEQKWLLKRLLCKYLPASLVYRSKQGFGAPVGGWLKGPLRDWAQNQLDPARIAREGHLQAAPITAIWSEFLAGERKWHTHLWNVVMFQAWLEWMNEQLHARTRRPEPSCERASA